MANCLDAHTKGNRFARDKVYYLVQAFDRTSLAFTYFLPARASLIYPP